jgi:hypothetical protein
MRRIILASLATLTLSTAPAAAQCRTGFGFETHGYGAQYSGSWGHRPSFPDVANAPSGLLAGERIKPTDPAQYPHLSRRPGLRR